RYVRSNLNSPFNPTEDYLWPLYGHWDKRTDYIAQLARTVPCDLPQWEGWFRKWFLYMVAQWLGRSRNYGNAVVPLLVSKQGDNKSTFCRSLLPDTLQWGYTDSLNVSDKRQTLQAMHSFLLINLDEFNQIPARIQEGFLKNVIQLPRVKIKRPYGRHVEDFPRRASFIATTNEATVLADPTGNRRFIGVRLTGPIDVSRRPNYEQLYAQAVEAVVDGEQYWFDEQEVKDIMAHNRQFEITPPAVLYFNEYYDVAASEEEGGEWLSPTAIYQRLRRAVGAGLQANGVTRFGRYLANIPGLQQRRVGNSKQYLVRAKQ
ncbi:MAG: DUF3874 domain-containing protein, partial [Prevotella sp.]|nr:DUF3874 domain-containing protein [Prevotella sp.]